MCHKACLMAISVLSVSVALIGASAPASAQGKAETCKRFVLRDGPGAPAENAQTRQAARAVGCKARHAKDGGGRPLKPGE